MTGIFVEDFIGFQIKILREIEFLVRFNNLDKSFIFRINISE